MQLGQGMEAAEKNTKFMKGVYNFNIVARYTVILMCGSTGNEQKDCKFHDAM